MDIWHQWSGDLDWSASGDLRAPLPSERGRQRVLRRLLTNEGGYIWHPDYGAGLPQLVGEPDGAGQAEARARVQMLFERAVSRDPLPQVTASGDARGAVTVQIGYTDADLSVPVTLGFTIRD